VDLSTPATMSPVTCWKLPHAKNLSVMSTCFVAETGWLRFVAGLISSSTRRVIYLIVCLLRRYRWCNSLSL
jgi:hypothetical protein